MKRKREEKVQITIDKKTGSLLAVIIVLLAVLGFFVLRDSESQMDSEDMGQGMNHATSSFAMDSSEVMFAQMMIPHHEQAVIMSELALGISVNKEVLEVAAQIKAAQAPEIAQMKSWLEKVGAGNMMDHNMGMNGMISDSDLATLKDATGTKFDKLFLEGMIKHHEGAIQMASMIKNSSNAEIKSLHDNIVKTQSAEITKMKAMLSTVSN